MSPCAGPYEKAKTLMEMGGRTDPCVACTQVRPWLLLLTPARIGTDCAAGQSTAQDAPSRRNWVQGKLSICGGDWIREAGTR